MSLLTGKPGQPQKVMLLRTKATERRARLTGLLSAGTLTDRLLEAVDAEIAQIRAALEAEHRQASEGLQETHAAAMAAAGAELATARSQVAEREAVIARHAASLEQLRTEHAAVHALLEDMRAREQAHHKDLTPELAGLHVAIVSGNAQLLQKIESAAPAKPAPTATAKPAEFDVRVQHDLNGRVVLLNLKEKG